MSRCQCESLDCRDYRALLLDRAMQPTDRPSAISDRRSAAQFLMFLAGELALQLDAAAAEGDETDARS
jgi:hypothetical protein